MLPETLPKMVHALGDGRFFITDQTVREIPELPAILARMSNYWTRHEYLDGWVSPLEQVVPNG